MGRRESHRAVEWHNVLGKHLRNDRKRYTIHEWMSIMKGIRKDHDALTEYWEEAYKAFPTNYHKNVLSHKKYARVIAAASIAYFNRITDNPLIKLKCTTHAQPGALVLRYTFGDDLLMERMVFYYEDFIFDPEGLWTTIEAKLRRLSGEMQARYRDMVYRQEALELNTRRRVVRKKRNPDYRKKRSP